MPYVGQTITEVFPTSISVDSATIKGDTTIGDASAADKKILFDGNAVDYHIGLDDSADSLIIGKGSALGTTTSMAFNADGIITKPLQPAFLVQPTSTQSNFSVGSHEQVILSAEKFDNNADFGSNVFTAPVTGKYQFNANLYLVNIDSASDFYQLRLVSSNRSLSAVIDPDFGQDNVYFSLNFTALIDMDVNDTAYLDIRQGSGTAQTDIDNGTTFSGYLVA